MSTNSKRKLKRSITTQAKHDIRPEIHQIIQIYGQSAQQLVQRSFRASVSEIPWLVQQAQNKQYPFGTVNTATPCPQLCLCAPVMKAFLKSKVINSMQ